MLKLIIFCWLLGTVLTEKLFIGDQVLRITAKSEEQFHLLLEQYELLKEELQLDLWGELVRGSQVLDVHVPFTSIQTVKASLGDENIQYDVIIEDVQALLNEEKQTMALSTQREGVTGSFDYSSYHTLEQINAWMDSLVTENHDLISKITIGQSYEKRPLYVLKFSTGANRPAIWIDSGIHAREWITPATGLWIAKKIATTYGQDPSVTALLNKMDIFFEIVVNPDGYVYTHTTNRMWRKTRSINADSPCVGVDPNRNWGADFGGPGSSANPCDETYSGPFVHSEPEVKAIVDFILGHGNFKALISIHSFSQMLLYPFGYTYKPASNSNELHALAKRAVGVLEGLYGTKYTYGSTINTIYPASGTTADWAYLNGLKYSYTFELRDTGRYGFLLPAEQILPTAQETWPALLTIMEHVNDHPY